MNFFRCLKKNRLFSFIFVSFSVKFSQTALNFSLCGFKIRFFLLEYGDYACGEKTADKGVLR